MIIEEVNRRIIDGFGEQHLTINSGSKETADNYLDDMLVRNNWISYESSKVKLILESHFLHHYAIELKSAFRYYGGWINKMDLNPPIRYNLSLKNQFPIVFFIPVSFHLARFLQILSTQ